MVFGCDVNAFSMDMHTNNYDNDNLSAIYRHANSKVFCRLRLMPVVGTLYMLRKDNDV